MPFLLVALIVVPLVEIALFIQVGGLIGLVPTLAVIVATALAGAALLRAQGLRTLHTAQRQLERAEMPVQSLFDGLCLFVAGLLLLTPGFLTDAVGFLLFVPAVRRALAVWTMARLRRHGAVQWEMRTRGPAGPGDGPGPRPGPRPGPDGAQPGGVIDAEFTEVEEPDEERRDGDAVVPPVDRSRWGRRQ
jgi:UPF0716 protein FxsA